MRRKRASEQQGRGSTKDWQEIRSLVERAIDANSLQSQAGLLYRAARKTRPINISVHQSLIKAAQLIEESISKENEGHKAMLKAEASIKRVLSKR